jgi:hypothetical protein
VHDGGIAEQICTAGAFHAVERGIQARKAEFARLVRARLHIGLVDLHDIGAGGEQS